MKLTNGRNKNSITFSISNLLSKSIGGNLHHLLYPVKQHHVGTVNVHLLVIEVERFPAVVGPKIKLQTTFL